MAHEFPYQHFLRNTETKNEPPHISNETKENDKYQEVTNDSSNSENFSHEELKELSLAIKGQMAQTLPAHQYNTYIADGLNLKSLNADKIEFSAKTDFIKSTVEKNFYSLLSNAVHKTLGKAFNIKISADRSTSSEIVLSSDSKPKSVGQMKFSLDLNTTHNDHADHIQSDFIKHMKGDSYGTTIDTGKHFDSFIVGPSNNLAYASSLAVAQAPGKKYPSLYIHSSSGLGKTHLLHAVANGIREKYPEMRICLITAREFMKEMINYIRENNIAEFQRKYSERIDVLMIDDIHELKKKTGTQDEFFHIFNELYNKEKQLIFTSDKSPQEIDGIEERVKTRLQWGLVVDIQKPDLETRIAILQEKAKQEDLNLSDDILTLIATSVKSSIRELEGSLTKLAAFTDMMNVEIDHETVKDLLKIENDEAGKKITLEDIAKASAQHFKIPLADLKSKSRNKDIAKARHIAMYLGRKMIHATQQEIGDFFGGRDHSTVINGVRKVEEQLKTNASLSKDIFEVESRL